MTIDERHSCLRIFRGVFMPKLKCVCNCALGLTTFVPSLVMAQTCQTETEIPSSTPNTRYIDHSNGTVTDSKTGLMWMKCSLGQSGNDCATGGTNTYNWQEALVTADGYSFAGYTDWRLPNIKELRSIVEQRCYDPSINLDVFPATPISNVWSASPYSYLSNSTWVVDSYYGVASHDDRSNFSHVRLVRSEPQ